jgi:ribonucleoside-diphosphate reductase alpha chain
VVMRAPAVAESEARASSNVTAIASSGATARHGGHEAATALKTAEPERALSPTEKLEAQNWSKSGSAAAAQPSKAERREEAKAKGYEGEMCGECGHFSLVRNGTCMKCDTCGSTTGCS